VTRSTGVHAADRKPKPEQWVQHLSTKVEIGQSYFDPEFLTPVFCALRIMQVTKTRTVHMVDRRRQPLPVEESKKCT
jgi:hypothetical protein